MFLVVVNECCLLCLDIAVLFCKLLFKLPVQKDGHNIFNILSVPPKLETKLPICRALPHALLADESLHLAS